MSNYEYHLFTSVDTLLSDLNTFVGANGWSVDFFGVYSGHNRLHVHKDTAHFEFWWYNAAVVGFVGCTGYLSGNSPSTQPGASGISLIDNFTVFTGVTLAYRFIIFGSSLYIGKPLYTTGLWVWTAVGSIVDKVGSWTGGQFICGLATTSYFFTPNSYLNSQLLINGAWTPRTLAGGFAGGSAATDKLIVNQPFNYNAGILPCPVTLFVHDTVLDTSTFHPLGFAPNVMRFSGGGSYVMEQIITIGSQTWIAMPNNALACGVDDLLFRLT